VHRVELWDVDKEYEELSERHLGSNLAIIRKYENGSFELNGGEMSQSPVVP
jgi:hypothetical protein